MKAIWNNTIIAESDETMVIEGNYYFPIKSLNKEYFTPSATHTVCPYKGKAGYYTIQVNGRCNPDAAWFYLEPKPAYQEIAGYAAFQNGVAIEYD